MRTSLHFPKPIAGILLAGLTYLGIRSLTAKQNRAEGYKPDANDTLPLAVAQNAVSKLVKKADSRKVPQQSDATFPLKFGSKGKLVEALQTALGLKADGIFGKHTLAALKAKYNIVSVSREYYLSIVPANNVALNIQGNQPKKGQPVVSTAPYVLPAKITVPGGFLLGYCTGRFNTDTDLVSVRSVEVTCIIDGTNAHCPESLKQYHNKRFTYWTAGHSYRIFAGLQAAISVYPQLSITSGFIKN